MILSFDSLSPSAIYFTFIQTIIPRPIAWVLTQNQIQASSCDQQDQYNLAPFSYFTPICSSPPLLLFSVGKKPDGSAKDTLVNMQQSGECVIHIASAEQAIEVTESSRTLVYGESELANIDHKLVEFEPSPLPRLDGCPIAFYGVKHDIQDVGNAGQSLVIVEVKSAFIDDAVIDTEQERLVVAAEKVNPLARLGADQYAELGDLFKIARPK